MLSLRFFRHSPGRRNSGNSLTEGSTRQHRHRARLRVEPLEDRSLMSHMPMHGHALSAAAFMRVPRSLFYNQTNLVSDSTSIPAAHTDPNLVNAWGIVSSATSPFWISDNGTGVSTLYTGNGTAQSLIVTIPPPTGATGHSAPTGIVFNSSKDFVVTAGGKSGSSVFLFATEDGTIAGWSPAVDGTHAILAVDNSGSGAVYKGLAMAASSTGNRLFATNFHAGTVDVFDASFKPVVLAPGAFTDRRLPRGFAPFGITNLDGNLLVTYAKQDAAKHDDSAGRGRGAIDLFSPDGALLKRVARGGALNSPWGMAVAPSTFGKFHDTLLVGNFGDGRINAFRLVGNRVVFAGQLATSNRRPLKIDGLWGLSFGNNAKAGSADTLFFTAGPNGEADGLFGSLTPTAPQ